MLFLLANFHVLDRDWFAKAWPAGLILLGVWIMFDRMRKNFLEKGQPWRTKQNRNARAPRCRMRGLMGPLMLITIGVIFLLGRFTSVGFEELWPVILVVAGVVLLLQSSASRAGHTGS